MPPDYLTSRLALTDAALTVTHNTAYGLLCSLAVTALIFASIRTAVLGGREPVSVLMQLLLCIGLLAIYRDIFGTLVGATGELANYMARHANWDQFWDQWDESITSLMAQSDQDGLGSQIMSYLQGQLFGAVTAAVTFFAFLVHQGIQVATAVFLSVLRVMGPLMIAGGIFAGGQTIRQWFNALLQVLLWPVVPPIIMMLVSAAGPEALSNDNVAFAIGQNLLFGMLAMATPLLVSFIVGRCGLAAFAGIATAIGSGLVMRAGAAALSGAVPLAGAMAAAGSRVLGAFGGLSAQASSAPVPVWAHPTNLLGAGAPSRPGSRHPSAGYPDGEVITAPYLLQKNPEPRASAQPAPSAPKAEPPATRPTGSTTRPPSQAQRSQ